MTIAGARGAVRSAATADSLTMSDPNKLELPVLRYDAGGGVTIDAVNRRDPPALWAVRWQGDCLSRDGEWEWEPSPSNRDDQGLARYRYATAADALAAVERWRAAKVG